MTATGEDRLGADGLDRTGRKRAGATRSGLDGADGRRLVAIDKEREGDETMKNRKAVYERMQKLADENGGELTHDILINDARKEGSPLRSVYEWSAEAGLAKWQKEQSRNLIRSYKIEYVVNRRVFKAPAFVHNPNKQPHEHSYIEVAKLQDEETTARRAVLREIKAAMSILERARSVAAVLELSHLFDNLMAEAVRVAQTVSEEEIAS